MFLTIVTLLFYLALAWHLLFPMGFTRWIAGIASAILALAILLTLI